MKQIRNLLNYIRRNPDLCLLQALIVSLPFERIPSVDVLSISVRPSLLVGVLLVIRVLWRFVSKEKLKPMSRWMLLIPLYLLWLAIHVPISLNPLRALQVTVFTAFTASVGLSVMYSWMNIGKEGQRRVLQTLIYTAVAVCIFGIYQYFGNFLGLAGNITGLSEQYSWRVFGFARIQSTGLEPLYFASFLLLPMLLWLTEVLYKRKSPWLDSVFLGLFMLTIILTLSRGAIYGFVGALAFIVAIHLATHKRFKAIGLKKVSIALICGIILALGAVQGLSRQPAVSKSPSEGKRATQAYVKQISNTGSGDDRSKFRRQAIKMSLANPQTFVFGIGPGQFGPYIQNNQTTGGWTIVNNLPLEVLLESGLIGSLLLAAFLISLVVKSFKTIKALDITAYCLLLGLLAYLFSQAIQYQTFSTLYIMHIWVAIGLLMAIVSSRTIRHAK